MALDFTLRDVLTYSRTSVKGPMKKVYKMLQALDTRITTLDSTVDGLDTENNTEHMQVRVPADSAATDAWEVAVFKAPSDGSIEDVIAVPDSDIGQATNFMTLDVQNKGTDGTGTDSIGSRAVNSVNTVEGMVGEDLVTTDADIDEGEVLSLKKTVDGDGQSWPGGIVQVKFTRD